MRFGRAGAKGAIKLIIFGALIVLAVLAAALTSRAFTGITRSEETNAVFNAAATPPPELLDSVVWEPDPGDLKRQMEPLTRVDVTSSWIRAWEQLSVVAQTGDATGLEVYFSNSALEALLESVGDRQGLPIHQLGHRLRMTFYSQDGQVIGLTADEVRLVRATEIDGVVGWKATVESYEAVLLLEDGTWRIQHWVRRSQDEHWWTDPAEPPLDPFQTSTDQQVGSPLALNGINYYPRDHPFDAFWANYDPTVVDADLDRIADIGLDSIRIFLPFDELGGRWTSEEDLAPVLDFMDRADERGLGVMVTLFDGRTDHRTDKWSSDVAHLETVVPALAGHPALIMWDLKNEPDRDIGKNGVDEQLMYTWLGYVARAVRDLDLRTPMTVGWSTPEAALAAPIHTDVVSFHYYRSGDDLATYIEALHEHGDGRPVLLTEYGLTTWNSVFPGGNSEDQQAGYLADVLTTARTAGLDGTMVWTLWDLADSPVDAGPMPWQAGPQRAYGLLRADGTAKPALAAVTPTADLDTVPRPGLTGLLGVTMWRMLVMCVVVSAAGLSAKVAGGRWWRKRRKAMRDPS